MNFIPFPYQSLDTNFASKSVYQPPTQRTQLSAYSRLFRINYYNGGFFDGGVNEVETIVIFYYCVQTHLRAHLMPHAEVSTSLRGRCFAFVEPRNQGIIVPEIQRIFRAGNIDPNVLAWS